MRELTQRESEVLGWIAGTTRTRLQPPTVGEVATRFEILGPDVWRVLRALVRTGYLHKEEGLPVRLRPVVVEHDDQDVDEAPEPTGELERMAECAAQLLAVVGELYVLTPGGRTEFNPCPHANISEVVRDKIRPWVEPHWRRLLDRCEEILGPLWIGEQESRKHGPDDWHDWLVSMDW